MEPGVRSGSRDLSAVLNAVAGFQPEAFPTKQASEPALKPVSLASVSCNLSLPCRAQRGRRRAAGGRRPFAGPPPPCGVPGRRAGWWRLRARPLPSSGLCSSPCPVPPKRARGPGAASWRWRGGEDGDLEGGARSGHGRGVPSLRASALQRPQAAVPAAAGGLPRAQGGPRAVQG